MANFRVLWRLESNEKNIKFRRYDVVILNSITGNYLAEYMNVTDVQSLREIYTIEKAVPSAILPKLIHDINEMLDRFPYDQPVSNKEWIGTIVDRDASPADTGVSIFETSSSVEQGQLFWSIANVMKELAFEDFPDD